MRLEEGELVKRLEQGMKLKWNWSLKEKQFRNSFVSFGHLG